MAVPDKRTLEGYELRRKPEAPFLLELRDPRHPAKEWHSGPYLGKFLQSHMQWDLADMNQRESNGALPSVSGRGGNGRHAAASFRMAAKSRRMSFASIT